eukprot:COSAG02_NODE_873_length_16302_cov_113.473616_14_plen_81_part_00
MHVFPDHLRQTRGSVLGGESSPDVVQMVAQQPYTLPLPREQNEHATGATALVINKADIDIDIDIFGFIVNQNGYKVVSIA